ARGGAALRPPGVRALRDDVPPPVRSAHRSHALHPLRRGAPATRRRPRGDDPSPHGRLRPGDGARPRAPPGRRAAARGRRDGRARRGVPAGRGGRAMILLKSKDEIDRMRAANAIVAAILLEVRSRVRPGVSTAELDALAEELTLAKGARPAFKGYTVGGRVFPASICISINDEVVHGIPSERRVLREGDIVGLDFGVCSRGYFGDAAMTVPVGRVTPDAQQLMTVTRDALAAGIDAVRAGSHVADISAAIQDTAERAGYSLVREFVGHGIRRTLH